MKTFCDDKIKLVNVVLLNSGLFMLHFHYTSRKIFLGHLIQLYKAINNWLKMLKFKWGLGLIF